MIELERFVFPRCSNCRSIMPDDAYINCATCRCRKTNYRRRGKGLAPLPVPDAAEEQRQAQRDLINFRLRARAVLDRRAAGN